MALTRPSAAQINTNTIDFNDPLLRINKTQTGINDKDIGFVFERGSDTNVAFIWDESEDQFALINTAETGSTNGNVSVSSYANIRANAFYGDGSNLTGIDVSNFASYLSENGYDTSANIVASITDSAPATLNTLNELAAALGDDANFSTTVTNSIATKLPLAGGTMSGNIVFSGTQLFDGRDVSADGAKLDGIESGATADQTANEILTAIKTVDGSGSGLDADTVDGVQGSSFLRSDQSDTIDAGVNTTLTILCDDTGASTIQLYGDSQGTGRVYVGQSSSYGGGIEYNGDNSPTTTGAGADYITLWRRAAGTDYWTARNQYSSNDWEFRGNVSAVNFNGVASSAKYADLAENYLADSAYPIGTVLDIGGDAEVTIATKDSYRVAGTVSENPGYLMNSKLTGEYVTPVAYIGRVPCRVQGTIHRGDMLIVSSIPGVAVACHPKDILPGQAIGKALESFDNASEGLIEILVGRL